MNYKVDPKARKIYERFDRSLALTGAWRKRVNELKKMYLNDQWDEQELEYMKKHKRHPMTINIMAPIIDGHVAMLASNSPRYKAVPSTGKANLAARAADFMLEYIAYISHFPSEFVPCMRDYSIAGLGWMMTDVDVLADFSYGEVKNLYLDLSNVFWDWRARRPGFSDMEWVTVFKWISAGRLKSVYDEHKAKIDEAAKFDWSNFESMRDLPASYNSGQTRVVLPGDIPYDGHLTFTGDEAQLPVLQYYEMIYKKMMFVRDPATGAQNIYTIEEWEEARIQYDVMTRDRAREIIIPHVHRTTVVADYLVLEEREYRLSNIPVVPFVRLSSGSAMPQGIAERLYDIQIDYNKRRIAIQDNSMTSATGRLLAPEKMIDEEKYYERYRFPGALLTYKPNLSFEQNPIIQLQAQPLPNQFYYMDQSCLEQAEYVTGVDSMMIGSSKNLPDTYRQSLMVDSYNKRRIEAIDMTSVDRGLEMLGQVTLEMAQWWYEYDKEMMILDDDGRMREFVISRVDPSLSGDGRPRASLDDFRGTRFNVRIVTGSTMPSNKYALLELYMGLYDRGFPVEKYVLQHTDIIEYDEIMQDMDKLAQASRAIEELQSMAKDQATLIDRLKNQLVTAEIKDKSRELMMADTLASMQRQAQERLAKAMIELSARDTQREIEKTAAIEREVSKARVRNIQELARAKVLGRDANAQSGRESQKE